MRDVIPRTTSRNITLHLLIANEMQRNIAGCRARYVHPLLPRAGITKYVGVHSLRHALATAGRELDQSALA